MRPMNLSAGSFVILLCWLTQAHLVACTPGTVVICFELASITKALGAPGGLAAPGQSKALGSWEGSVAALMLLAVLVACVGLSCCLGSIEPTWLALCSWWAGLQCQCMLWAVRTGLLSGGIIFLQCSFCGVPPILPVAEQLPLSGIKD